MAGASVWDASDASPGTCSGHVWLGGGLREELEPQRLRLNWPGNSSATPQKRRWMDGWMEFDP